MAEDQEAPRRREGRPHIIPPAPGWRVDAQGRPEGWPVLDDVDGALGLTLWRALRAVWTWVDTPPERRGGLSQEPTREVRERFAYAALEAPELESAFGTFALLVRAANVLDGTVLAEACAVVHTWAEARGLTETAVHFAEASARADEEDAYRANLAGRTCRRAGLNDRASMWFARAFGVALRARNSGETIRALLGYGALMKELGRHDEARRLFLRAARRAARTGRRRQAAEAQHDLMTLAVERGTYEQAEDHLRQALRLYPARHPRLPALAFDWGFLLVRLGLHSEALPLLERLGPLIQRPEDQTLVWSVTARAAAGAGHVGRHDELAERVFPAAGLHAEYAAGALYNLAEAAVSLGRWERAEILVEAALELARARNDAEVERVALDLCGRIARREVPAHSRSGAGTEPSRALSRRLAARLARWKALTHRSAVPHSRET
ncbi:MAG TPA: tetratricopeptide repeat protein [Longimicrobium sp.]|jgi:tetratricopeptide (TPR) repeat protein